MAIPTIALDVMGGDDAPGPELAGAVAARKAKIARIVLVGDEAKIHTGLASLGVTPDADLVVRHAAQVITMEDHPAQAARGKKDSSMRVAFELVKRGDAQGVVSAGNSGAMMACGLFVLRRVSGLDRPGICTTFPTRTGLPSSAPSGAASRRAPGVCALIDMGANTDVRPITLAHFAVLGATYVRLQHGIARPRVGLLSNGSEDGKGTEVLREALALLRGGDAGFDFVGFVEGRDIFNGRIDVVVTDGFTGNVVLKTAEGAASLIGKMLKDEILASPLRKLGALFMKGALDALKRKIDPDESGGAPLLGVEGNVVICHGGSSAHAIYNGIQTAARLSTAGLVDAVKVALAESAPLWDKAGESGSTKELA